MFRFSLLVAALLAVAAPSAASAYTPPARALYGGRAIGPKFNKANHSDVTWASARVSQDQQSVTFYADVDLTCGTYRGIVLTNASAPVQGGKFAGSFTIDPATNSGIAGTLTFSGKFTERGLASGTIRTSTTRNGAPCTSRTVPYELRLPSRTPYHPSDKVGGTYYGSTDQTYPVLLRTDRSRRHLLQGSLEFDYGCPTNPQRTYSNETTPPTTISRTGKFHGVESYASPLAGGMTAHFTSDVTGRFQGNRARGIWKIDVQITRDADNSVVDNCTSGPMKFTTM